MTTFFSGEGFANGASRKTDDEGHVLVSLWEDYKKAKEADLPQKEADILENIMDRSKAQNLYWDYCCASTEWYNAVTRRNWKLQDSSKTRILDEVAKMDCPILTFTQKNFFRVFDDAAETFVDEMQTRSAELRKSVNSGFYTALKNHAPDFIVNGIANDYEYLLWAIGLYGDSDEGCATTAAGLLDAELNGKYPASAFLEFLNVLRNNPLDYTNKIVPYDENALLDENCDIYNDDYDDNDDFDDYDELDLSDDTTALGLSLDAKSKALAEFSKKYEGRAVALFSDQQILIDRAHELYTRINDAENITTSEDYKTLRADCVQFNARRDAFSGDEAAVASAATKIDALIKYLDAQAIRVSALNDEITILLQNVDSVSLKFYRDGELFHTSELKNPLCSCFLTDTLKYKFPDCPDGEYKIICTHGELKAETTYTMHSISVAYRDINTGTGLYIADYISGRPISEADIEIFSNSVSVLKVSDFHFDGFTSIQELLDSVATDKSKRVDVRCSYTDDNGWHRCSNDLSFWVKKGEAAQVAEPQSEKTAKIFTDRAAFNPGDSVQFKLLAYYIEADESFRLVNKGHRMRMELADPEGNVIDSVALIANEFGTAAGKFDLPDPIKGGTYTLKAYYRNTLLASSRITVDEFVLPSYDLTFDKVDTPYFAGDTVSVKGRLVSYSGHSLSSVKLAYEIEYYADERKTLRGNVIAGSDGRFDIQFATDKADGSSSTNYYLTLKATALNGETWSWSKTIVVNPLSSMSFNFSGNAEGFARERNGKDVTALMQSDSIKASFNLSIRGVETLPVLPVDYTVRRGGVFSDCNEGSIVLTGTASSGTAFGISLDGFPSGLYTVEGKTEYLTPSGHKITLRSSGTLLKVAENDSTIPEGVAYYHKKQDNGHIAAQFAISDPERWFVVEVLSSDKELLHSEVICIGTDSQSAKTLDFEFMDSYTDAVRLQVFSFGNSSYVEYSFLYERPADPAAEFPLSFSTFTDKALPHSECTLSLQTNPDVEAVVTVFDKSTETIRSNVWTAIRRYVDTSFRVGIGSRCGSRSASSTYWNKGDFYDSSLWSDDGEVSGLYRSVTYSAGRYLMTRALTSESMAYDSETVGALPMNAVGLDEDGYVDEDADTSDGADISDVQVRDGMDHATVFLPFLRSDKNGKIELSFTTADRLSTYYVQVFAHDGKLGNGVLRREMTVSLPLEVSVAQPQFLYAGDVYKLRASVSNSDSKAYDGTMVLEVYNTEDYKDASPVAKYQKALTVGADTAASAEFEINVPYDVSTLGFKVAFIGSVAVESGSNAEAGKDPVSGNGIAGGDKVGQGSGETLSDAVFVSVPMKEPVQTVIEAHSAVVSGDKDEQAVRAGSAAQFTGTDADGAEYSEVSLLDMIQKAIPSYVGGDGKDVLSRSAEFYVGRMAEYLSARMAEDFAGQSAEDVDDRMAEDVDGQVAGQDTDAGSAQGSPVGDKPNELLDMILACQNSDGGFAWFEGFSSSPALTVVVLERFARLRDRGLIAAELAGRIESAAGKAVRYLDNSRFSTDYPLWCGGLSLEQYLRVRVMYPGVTFEPVIPAGTDRTGYGLDDFKKDVKSYLLPKDKASLYGYILAKARRVRISYALSSDKCSALAKAWGLNGSLKKVSKSVAADMLSLSEYAVEHPSGGVYYPNAVMPFRGLLESEAYAHGLLCELMEDYAGEVGGVSVKGSADKVSGVSVKESVGKNAGAEYHRIAEGIRLWLMIQKESQQWDDDPAFVDAIALVLDGTDETLHTKIAVLTKQYTKPFGEIVAAGNGFTVSRSFYRTVPVTSAVEESGMQGLSSAAKTERVELKEGDVLNVGDKIIAEYRVWNEENRSFVRLETPRHAALRPVEQLSGNVGWWTMRIPTTSFFYFTPCVYREVKADKTVLYFDVCPEENLVLTEDFYVTQAGTFSSPAVTVESMYAPHYRANDSAASPLIIE